MPARHNTPLGELEKVTRDIAESTGCTRAVTVAHVLVGTHLLVEPVRYTMAWGGGHGIHRRTATIEILNPQALTLPVLMKAYSGIRAHLGLTKKKTLSERHERLLRLVDKHGGVPRRGKTRFWEGIQKEWNRAVPQGRRCFTTWMGPKMAYDRISAVLKKRRDPTA